MTDGPPYDLTMTDFYTLLGRPDFYVRVPFLHWLKRPGLDVHDRIRAGSGCEGCGTDRRILRPILTAVGQQCAELQRDNPEALEPFAQYVAELRGHRPRPIRLRYAEGGRVRTLEI